MFDRLFMNVLRRSGDFYKFLLVLISAGLVTYFFPDKTSFPYHYTEGRPWTYANLYAPFDFAVKKSADEWQKAKDSIKQSAPLIYNLTLPDTAAVIRQFSHWLIRKNIPLTAEEKHSVVNWIKNVYSHGLTDVPPENPQANIRLLQGKKLIRPKLRPYHIKELERQWKTHAPVDSLKARELWPLIFQSLKPNLKFNPDYTGKYRQNLLNKLNPNEKIIYKGMLIVSKGEKIGKEQIKILDSLKQIFGNEIRDKKIVLAGYFLVSVLLFVLLIFYFKTFKKDIYYNNSELSLIVLNILLITLITFLMQRYFPQYIYVIPFVVLPVITKSFFDWDTSLIVLGISVLLIAPGMESPYEYAYLQSLAGLTAILTVTDLTKRSQLFLSVGKIVLVYFFGYMAFVFIVYGDWKLFTPSYGVMFFVNGLLAVALVHELILLFEKTFDIPSDVAYLELLNTDNKLLKELAAKAPGTFQHSLQVGNLAEAIAKEIGANALLVRVAALYHDIGKMKNPKYFTENQISDYNPHDNLKPEESARIIINHVIDGIEMARKNNIPERIIDFIRTHHGTGLVKYFFHKAQEAGLNPNPEDYRYPGPNPFSKETAILMMADSVEAASKSLQQPTAAQLDQLVDKIIDGQLHEGLFNNADITLKEINKAKKVLKNKLRSIYHLRVEYPE